MANVFKSIGNFVSKSYSTVKKVGSYGPKLPEGTKMGNAPLSVPASGVAKIGKGIKSVWDITKTFTTKKTINPATGVKGASNILKTLGKSAGVGALVGTIFQGGRLVSKAGVSGETPSGSEVVSSLTKGATTGAGLGLSPAGGVIGAIEGGAIATGSAVSNVSKKFWDAMRGQGQSTINDATNTFKDITQNMPTNPAVNINNYYPDVGKYTMSDIMPQSPTNIYVESPATPQASLTSPSFSPSFSLGGVGGGLNEVLPLLLLAGGLGGGYLLGKKKRKKRKKKKYKKRRT